MAPKSVVITGQYDRKEEQPKGPQDSFTSINKSGEYKRKESAHRDFVVPGSKFEPEAGRYHLYVSLACPWACGTLSMLFEKGLEDIISHSIVHPTWGKTKESEEDTHCGWLFKAPGDAPVSNPLGHGSFDCDDALVPDSVCNATNLREVYEVGGNPTGPFSTPVLFDKRINSIVNNESKEILRIFNSAFDAFAKSPGLSIFPPELEAELVELNDTLIYPKINNGVYRAGFARTQQAYDTAVTECFAALEQVEKRLGASRFLSGDQFTWLDLRLFHTLVRFDPVYTCYFKTNEKRIADFPNLLGFVRDVYSRPAIRRSINIKHIKMHYFTSHPHLNTYAVIPTHDGPDLNVAHGRALVGRTPSMAAVALAVGAAAIATALIARRR